MFGTWLETCKSVKRKDLPNVRQLQLQSAHQPGNLCQDTILTERTSWQANSIQLGKQCSCGVTISVSIIAATPGCWFAWQSIFLEESLPFRNRQSGCNIFRFMQPIEMQNLTLLSSFCFTNDRGRKIHPNLHPPYTPASQYCHAHSFTKLNQSSSFASKTGKAFRKLERWYHNTSHDPYLESKCDKMRKKMRQNEKMKKTRKEKTDQKTWPCGCGTSETISMSRFTL